MSKKIILIIIMAVSFSSTFAQGKKQDTSTKKFNPITVTAMRYAEPIIEVPLAMTIIHNSSFINGKSLGLDEALSMVPGVFAQSRYGNQDVRISIRGYGARGAGDRSNAGTSRGIKLFLDGVPETEPDGRTSFDNFDLSNVSKIEVIRSNASALWGNAAGGVISLSTVPLFDDNMLRLSTSGGSYGFFKYSINAGTELDNGKIYGSYTVSKYDGYRQNSSSERHIVNLGFLSYLSPVSLLAVHVSGTNNLFYLPGPLTQMQFDSLPSMANPAYLSRLERRYNKTAKFSLNLDHSINKHNNINAMLFLNPKYLQRSERGTYRDFTRYHLGMGMNYRNNTEISKDIKNILVVGLDDAYQDGAILFYNLTSNAERGDTLKDNKSEGANTFGFYLQDEIIINDNISALIGGRYDDITYFTQSYLTLNTKQNRTFSKITPKFAISYRFNPSHSIYFNFGGGVEVPAGNETEPPPGMDKVLINSLLEPVESTTFEIGNKQILEFDDSFIKHITYDLAIYLINVKNDIVPYNGGRFYLTAAETQRSGIELGLSIKTKYGLSLNSAFTYSKNVYKTYKVDSTYYKNPGKFADYSNNKVPGIPNLYFSANIKYELPMEINVFAEFGLSGVGEIFSDDANKYLVPSHTLLNFKIGTYEPFDLEIIKLNLFVAINNLTDEKYASSAFINPDLETKTNKPIYLEPGLPRNLVFGASLAF